MMNATTCSRALLPSLLIFTRQFAAMVHSSMSLDNCAAALAEDAPPPYRVFAEEMRDGFRREQYLTDIMRARPDLFPPVYCVLIHKGEVGGIIDECLGWLVELLEEELKDTRAGEEGAAGLFYQEQRHWEELPPAAQYRLLSRWCRALGMMLGAGVPNRFALYVSAELLPPAQREMLSELAQQPDEQDTPPSLGELDFCPVILRRMLIVGEQSGTLDLQLEQASRLYHDLWQYHTLEAGRKGKMRQRRVSAMTLPAASHWESNGSDNPVTRLVTVLLHNAIKHRAHEIMLLTQPEYLAVSYRIDESWQEIMTLPLFAVEPTFRLIKQWAEIPPQALPPQQGQLFTFYEGQSYELCVAAQHHDGGEMLLLTVVYRDEAIHQ